MLKKPMTTGELFEKMKEILKEKGKLPDILDYGLVTHNPVPITNYEYSLKNKLDYGDNTNIMPELISYMDEVMPKKAVQGVDSEAKGEEVLDTLIDMEGFFLERLWNRIHSSEGGNKNKCLFVHRQMRSIMLK